MHNIPHNHTLFSGNDWRSYRVRLANRGRLLLRTPGPVPFGTWICSNVETIPSWTCHVYGPFEFRTSLGTSILLKLKPVRKHLWTFRHSCPPPVCLVIAFSNFLNESWVYHEACIFRLNMQKILIFRSCRQILYNALQNFKHFYTIVHFDFHDSKSVRYSIFWL